MNKRHTHRPGFKAQVGMEAINGVKKLQEFASGAA
jgi:hypothetical protein